MAKFHWITTHWRNPFFKGISIACIVSGLLLTYCILDYMLIKHRIINRAQESAREQTKKAAQEIDSFLISLQPVVQAIVNDLKKGTLSKQDVIKRLQEKAPSVAGLGIAFAPYAYDQSTKLYAPYYVEKDGKQQLIQLEKLEDYTTTNRYTEPLKKGALFLEPFHDKGSNTIVAEYAMPAYDQHNKLIGIVFANHSTSHMQYVIEGLELGNKGYGFIISQNGTYIAHPIKEYTAALKTIFQTAQEMNNKELEQVARKALEGHTGYIDHENAETGQQSWFFFQNIPSTNWSMVSVFVKDELDLNTQALKRKRIHIVLSLIIFLMFLSLLLFKSYRLENSALWLSSLTISFLLLCGTIFMWHTAYQATRYQVEGKGAVIIQDRTSLARYLEQVSAKPTEKADHGTTNHHNHTAPIPPAHGNHATMMHETLQTHIDMQVDINSTHNEVLQDLITERIPLIQQRIAKATQLLMDSVQEPKVSPTSPLLLPTKQPLSPATKPATAPKQSHAQHQATVPPTPHAADSHSIHSKQNAATTQVTPSTALSTNGIKNENLKDPAKPGSQHSHTAHRNESSMHIPTGLYLQHLELQGTNNAKFIGQFWQRFAKDIHDGIKRGIIFPLGEGVKTTKAYSMQDGNWELIGWNVQGSVAQLFNYTAYPFDTKVVQIQMWPYDFDKEVILAADLAAYKIINPTSLPGIDAKAKLQDWSMIRSFFSYKKNKYLTNFGNYITGPFGIIDRSTKAQTPDLYFNVTLQRHIISSLTLDLFPIIVIFCILFLLLFLTSQGLITQMNHILMTASSLFFSVILAHLRFKNTVPVQQVVFFEYFYFLLHFLIISVTIIALLYFLHSQIFFIRYKNLLIPQLLFWPFLNSAVLILSLIYFY